MQDVTDLMDHYRVAARSIWNTGFWSQEDLQSWDAWDQFKQIKKLLFKALVAARINQEHACDLDVVPDLDLRVVPNEPGPVSIMIQNPRPGDNAGYWDDPVKEISPSQANLQFIDYFDWDPMRYADFQFYRVRITDFPQLPHLVGREALVEHSHARVYLDSGQAA